MNPQSCVLAIWYTENGVKKNKPQGKIFQSGDNWFYVVNVDDVKLIKKKYPGLQGYTVAAQVLEAFENVGLKKVTVIFKDVSHRMSYSTTVGAIISMGKFDDFNSHRQWMMPIKFCSIVPYSNADPKGLPVVDVSDWSKGVTITYEYRDNTCFIRRSEAPMQMGLSL